MLVTLALLVLAGMTTACLPVRPLPLPRPPATTTSTTTTTTVRPTTTSTTTTTVPVPTSTVVAVPSARVGAGFVVSVPCSPRAGWSAGVVALVALVAVDSTVVATASASNTRSSVHVVDVVLQVPAGAAPGSYSVTSSCDSYLGSQVFEPVAVSVV